MKQLTILISIILLSSSVFAQHIPKMSQYELNKNLINPAAVTNSDLEANLLYRNQWTGFDSSPKTMGINISKKFKKMSAGLFVLNDKAGVFNQNIIHLNYGYSVPVSRNIFLQFGLSGGLNIYKIQFEELDMYHKNDPNIPLLANSVLLPDFNFGAFLTNLKQKPTSAFGSLAKHDPIFYVGTSIQHIVGVVTTSDIVKNNSYMLQHYNLMGGFKHFVGDVFQMEETILLKYVTGVPLQMDLGFRFFYNQSYWAGFSYRSSNDITAKIGIVYRNILFAYSYDFNISQIPNYNSHEIVIGFRYNRSHLFVRKY